MLLILIHIYTYNNVFCLNFPYEKFLFLLDEKFCSIRFTYFQIYLYDDIPSIIGPKLFRLNARSSKAMRFYFIVVDTLREFSLFLALVFSCCFQPGFETPDNNEISLAFLTLNSIIMATFIITSAFTRFLFFYNIK